MAFVLIQHLEPRHESALSALLSKATSVPVAEGVQRNGGGARPRIRHSPQQEHDDPCANIAARSEVESTRGAIPDRRFLYPLAAEQGNAALGVVLSGTGSDGTQGLRAIRGRRLHLCSSSWKQRNGPRCRSAQLLPGLSILCYHRSASPATWPLAQQHYVATAPEVAQGGQLDQISSIIWSSVGIDFRLYKEATIRRRIARRMALRKIESLNKFAEILKRNPEEVPAWWQIFSSHVTSFFGIRSPFRLCKNGSWAKLHRQRSAAAPLRIWVPGCSTGEEVSPL